jgi:hypothetical protein
LSLASLSKKIKIVKKIKSACGGGTVVEPLTHYPTFAGSNPAAGMQCMAKTWAVEYFQKASINQLPVSAHWCQHGSLGPVL